MERSVSQAASSGQRETLRPKHGLHSVGRTPLSDTGGGTPPPVSSAVRPDEYIVPCRTGVSDPLKEEKVSRLLLDRADRVGVRACRFRSEAAEDHPVELRVRLEKPVHLPRRDAGGAVDGKVIDARADGGERDRADS